MSTKAPDVMCAPPSPQTAITLAEMHIRCWELKAVCNRCGLGLRVSLPAMIRAYGPDAVWWGRRPTCPGLECRGGALTYSARSIRGGSWVSMAQPPGQGGLAAHRNRTATYPGPR